MRIDHLELTDFRGYDYKSFDFNSHFNVLIGENGSGKTTVLEALTVAISPFLSVLEGKQNVRPIRKEDVRHTSFEYSLEAKLNTAVGAEGMIDGPATVQWRIGKPQRDFGFMRGDDSALRQWARRCLEQLSENGGKDLILPLFCYMGAGRLWTESAEKAKIFPKGSRLEGYHQCLNAKGHFKRFVDWFKTMELATLQEIERERTGEEIVPANGENTQQNVEIIRRVVSSCLDDWDTIRYSVSDDMLMVVRGRRISRQTLPFHYLSDGQRNMIGMVADIAYRCLLLNPYLGEECNTRTPGIVLIDELDLHLHPNWQKGIVAKLKNAFPMIQFITTTHSPFIVQSLFNEELIDLQGKDLDTDYYRKSIEEIAGEEMGVSDAPRSERFQEMVQVAGRYFTLIKLGEKADPVEKAALKEQLNQLQELYSEDPAYVALLQAERDKAEME